MEFIENSRVLGRLLEELSWAGKTIKAYRNGGKGFENVLTAEVFQALDFLPRRLFLGAVVEASHGATKARVLLQQEIEQAEFTLLPGSFYLIPRAEVGHKGLQVQPDGIIQSPKCFGLIEAKRIKSSAFQPEQLAREFVLVMREAQNRDQQPVMWLILGSKPPVRVQRHGYLELSDAIELHLESVLNRTGNQDLDKELLLQQVDDVVCWTTWQTVAEVVQEQLCSITISDQSIKACMQRLVDAIIQSIDWHS